MECNHSYTVELAQQLYELGTKDGFVVADVEVTGQFTRLSPDHPFLNMFTFCHEVRNYGEGFCHLVLCKLMGRVLKAIVKNMFVCMQDM